MMQPLRLLSMWLAFMAVAEVVGVLVVVVVMIWWCKVRVTGNRCFSRCCSASDLSYTICGLCSCEHSYHCLMGSDTIYSGR